MSTGAVPSKVGTGGQLLGMLDSDPVVTKTFLPRRDILLGITPSATKFKEGVKGRSCTLHQRSSTESMSGGGGGSVELSPSATATGGVAHISSSQINNRGRSEPGKLEGITRQQMAWLEQQEIKPGHFTEAYIRHLSQSSRPLFSLKKMEVQERESNPKMAHKDRDRRGNSERKKNGSSTENSSRLSAQVSSSRSQEKADNEHKLPPQEQQAGLQYLPDGSSVINIPHGRVGEQFVQDSQSELDKLKNEMQSLQKGIDLDSAKLSKKSGSKTSSSKPSSKKSAPAKSKIKKPPVGNSAQVRGQQAKPPRAKPVSTKGKKKKSVRKLIEKSEEGEKANAVGGTNSDNLFPKAVRDNLTPQDASAKDSLKLPEWNDKLDDAAAIKRSVENNLRVSDAVGRNDSRTGSVSSSLWESKQQARADERRKEVERKRAEKRKLLMEQQKEEEERLRLKAELEKAQLESARLTDSSENNEGFEASTSNYDLESAEEARRNELARLSALQSSKGIGEDAPRLTEEELERMMREKGLGMEAERLRAEQAKLKQEEERLRREEDRIRRLKEKQETEERRKQEEVLKAQEEMARWRQELESRKRDTWVKEYVAQLNRDIEEAKHEAATVKRYEGSISGPHYFSYFDYCAGIHGEVPKAKPKNERGKKRPQSTLAK